MANIYDMVDTWNDGATTFTAIKMDVTDTASASGSLLLDLKVGGVTKASIDKNGNLTASLTAIDDVPIGATTPSTGAFTTLSATGTASLASITVTGTVDGRDIAADGAKLDGIEALADVTDTANVTAAGALMDGELTDIAAVKALNQGVATTDSPSFAGATLTTADINGGTIDGTVIGGTTAAAGTFTALSSDYLNETVYELTGTDIDPANGAIQYKTLGANTTFTESLSSGDSVILRLSGGDTYTVTYPTMTWVTSTGNTAPTLGGSDFIVIWQEGTTVYGAYIGSYA
jgi:hypothetical protein